MWNKKVWLETAVYPTSVRSHLASSQQHGLGSEHLWSVQGRREQAVLFCLLDKKADDVEEAPQASGPAGWSWSCDVAV